LGRVAPAISHLRKKQWLGPPNTGLNRRRSRSDEKVISFIDPRAEADGGEFSGGALNSEYAVERMRYRGKNVVKEPGCLPSEHVIGQGRPAICIQWIVRAQDRAFLWGAAAHDPCMNRIHE